MSDIQYVLMIIGAATCIFVLFLIMCLSAFFFVIGLDGYQARRKVRLSKHQSAGKVYDFPTGPDEKFFKKLTDEELRQERLNQEALAVLKKRLLEQPGDETMLMPAHLSVVKPNSSWEQIGDGRTVMTPVYEDPFNMEGHKRDSEHTPQPH